MTTTIPSSAMIPAEPVFSGPEQLALAGFLASYSGLTREAYMLDLRQFTTWCHQHGLHLFAVRRAGIECYARDMEAKGRAGPLSPAGWRPSPDCTSTRSKKNFLPAHRLLMSGGRGSITSPARSARPATKPAPSSSPPGSAPPPGTS